MTSAGHAARVAARRTVAAIKRVVKPWLPAQRLRYRLACRHLAGEGIEIGALHNPLRVPAAARVRFVDRLRRDDLLAHYPEMIGIGVVDPDIVDDGERLSTLADASLDFIIANNFIEHCQDPIGTLQTFFRKLKAGGVVYLAVPDKRYTFDRLRESTAFDHLEHDHRDGGASSRPDHFVDFARFAEFHGRGSEAEVQALAARWMAQDYSIHFHVWDHAEFEAALAAIRERYLPGMAVRESVRNGSENVFILAKGSA